MKRGDQDKDREKTEGGMTKKKKKGAEKREMRERYFCPLGVQVGRFTWRGQPALQRGDTQQGLMEGL